MRRAQDRARSARSRKNGADDIIINLEIIEKLLFPETDFWHDNYLNGLSPQNSYVP